jgi:hypothetical protein
MKQEDSSPSFSRSDEPAAFADVYFLTGQPFFEEAASVSLPPEQVVAPDSWQTVQIWPLHFYMKGHGYVSAHLAFDVHRECFAYLEAADERSVPILERIYEEADSEESEEERELFDKIGMLLETAEARVESGRLSPGQVVVYSEDHVR